MADRITTRFTSVAGGVGTTVITDQPTDLIRVVVPGTYVGTLNLHDAASATGTTSTSQILSLGLPTTTVAGNIEIGVHCKKGLLYQATGTPVMTIVSGE